MLSSCYLDFENQEINQEYIQRFQKRILPSHDPRWGRLLCLWHEKRDGDRFVTHIYLSRIDKMNGGFYLDSRPLEIFFKTSLQLIARPLFTAIKTVYHLSMIPIINEIGLALSGAQPLREGIKNSFRSIADILLTPLFGLAIMISSVAVLCLASCDPESIYSGSALIGEIERYSNWGMRHTEWTLAKCFQPFPWYLFAKYDHRDKTKDTIYTADSAMDPLANFARARIRFMRQHVNPLNCQKNDLNTPYRTA